MARKFTPEEIVKKHETNIKSAAGGYSLAGVLGIIYVVRYFVKKNFDFYFSLTFTELMLRLTDSGRLSPVVGYGLTALFIALYAAVAVIIARKTSALKAGLAVYLTDCLCFVPLFIFHGQIRSDYFIDVIVHLFVVLFLIVAVKSEKELRKK